MKLTGGLAAILLLAASLQGAERWRVQFRHDRGGSRLTINDLVFPSASRGVAVGYLSQGRKLKPVELVTGDGGVTWSYLEPQETGLSLFFLNESVGWMVTAQGLWKSSDSGVSWKKLAAGPATEDVLRVYFLDEAHGWTVGRRKSIHATEDGGLTWSRVEAAGEVASDPQHTDYNWITFVNQRFGMITGASSPPQPGNERRELPHLTIFLDTRDGGRNWKASTTSMFGRVAKVVFAPDGRGLGLIEFQNDFAFPSEVFGIDWKTGKSWRVFRREDQAVRDVAFTPAGEAYLAVVEQTGRARAKAAPGTLRLLKSGNLADWAEVEVSARIAARRAVLAVVDAQHAWMATDTGVILRLENP
jgi:photosystem II stability/assembly factor-like uncharacterized protein